MGGIQKLLKQELAEKIVNEVRKLIDEDVIVAGTDGIIIASTDKIRLNSFHEGAFLVSNNKQRLIITKEDEIKLIGVKAGVNFPIMFQTDVIGPWLSPSNETRYRKRRLKSQNESRPSRRPLTGSSWRKRVNTLNHWGTVPQ